jgi:DUF1680 family protein
MRVTRTAAGLAIALGLFTPACRSTVPHPAVADKVTPKAEPFDLSDVTLLDGPFRRAMELDARYLLSLDQDRLLHDFRINAGLPSAAAPLGGWEAPDVELRGHTIGHYLSALALMYASTGDDRFETRAETMVAELAKVQAALPSQGANPGYLSAFPESFIDRVERRERVWAPYYTLHKIMAGLLDVYLRFGDRQALDVVTKMADWVKLRVDRLTDDQMQAMLATEFGGMNDVLANLYAVTGDVEYLRIARKFDHKALFDPLAHGEDPLNGLHGNTQIPKMIGAAREYELTGETRYRDIATFFWQRVVRARSYVNGGNTDGESFFPPDEFSRHLGVSTTETCNTYNMLKLTRHLFAWEPSAEAMDYYERALFNQILGSQDPETGMVMYYCPLRPGAFKTYSTPDDSFWCCVGTGLENHGKYGDSIYFHDDRTLYVNLFIASELTWRDKGLRIRQETGFPDEDTTTLTMQSDRPQRLSLAIRYPAWATAGMMLSVNGTAQTVEATPGSYVRIDRDWRTGDRVSVELPMTLHLEAMPDDPNTVALLDGPIVLAGDLGTTGLESARRYGPSAPQLDRIPPVVIPALVGERGALLTRIEPVGGEPLHFRTVGLGRPADVELAPFYRLFRSRYTVYWKLYTEQAWATHEAEVAAAAARRRSIEKRTVDAVVLDEEQSESAHAFAGENTNEGSFEGRRWREARQGWFSYDLKVSPGVPVTLVCVYRGSGGRRRSFDILVNGERIATETLEYHPTEYFDREYQVPERLTRGRSRVTVRFQALPDATAGSVFEVRTVTR